MDTLLIEGTAKTPFVKFGRQGEAFEISGKSIPEDTIEFYKPVFDWLDGYSKEPAKSTSMKIQLEYFNTSSSKCLLDIFRKLEALQKSGRSEVTVLWMYEEEDEDMQEAGEDYQAIVDIPFQLTKVEA